MVAESNIHIGTSFFLSSGQRSSRRRKWAVTTKVTHESCIPAGEMIAQMNSLGRAMISFSWTGRRQTKSELWSATLAWEKCMYCFITIQTTPERAIVYGNLSICRSVIRLTEIGHDKNRHLTRHSCWLSYLQRNRLWNRASLLPFLNGCSFSCLPDQVSTFSIQTGHIDTPTLLRPILCVVIRIQGNTIDTIILNTKGNPEDTFVAHENHGSVFFPFTFRSIPVTKCQKH